MPPLAGNICTVGLRNVNIQEAADFVTMLQIWLLFFSTFRYYVKVTNLYDIKMTDLALRY